MATNNKLSKQLEFIIEIDKLKQVYRQSFLTCAPRHENDAEHSWHLAVMAMLLAEHAESSVDVLKVIKMVLIHDIIEIDAGDTYCYDEVAGLDKAEREQKAAARLFYILPARQAEDLNNLWEEFEARQTPEARFAAALDRLQPLILNYLTQGKSWQAHGITSEQVLKRNRHIGDSSPDLWGYAEAIIEDAVAKGYLAR